MKICMETREQAIARHVAGVYAAKEEKRQSLLAWVNNPTTENTRRVGEATLRYIDSVIKPTRRRLLLRF